MLRSGKLSEENQAVIVARVKQRVKEFLPPGQYIILVQEIPCEDAGCPTRATLISICNEMGDYRRLVIHAPLSMITTKEIKHVLTRYNE